jgi:hypothetical protein
MPANEQVQKYFEALIANYDLLAEALAKANERGLKVAKQLAADVAKGQREALELGKKLAGEPTDLGQLYAAVLEATTAAQGRALAFAQAAYQEALSGTSDSRESIEKLVAANRQTAEAAVAAMKQFYAANPMADVFKRGLEAMQPKDAKQKTAGKAAV